MSNFDFLLKELDKIQLKGDFCTLVPLSYEHLDDLIESTNDGELWKVWYSFVPNPQSMKDNITLRLKMKAAGTMMPFAVINNYSGKVVGMTTYMNIDNINERLEIGGTWYRKSVQRTALNTECKLLLLTYAFEDLHSIAVEFRTHSFNMQSRKGIERLGAKLDGILRNHMRMPNGTLRDTYVYSIILSEWPTVKSQLDFFLNR